EPLLLACLLASRRRPTRFKCDWSSDVCSSDLGFALTNRPELAESQALVQAALDRLRAARYRPLLPNVALGYNWGDFGGGPDPVPRGGGFGPSGRINHFKHRTDFEVQLGWRLAKRG